MPSRARIKTMKETSPSTISAADAMKLNRANRRKLGKMNGVKIMGSNTDHLKTKKPYALLTFTGIKK